MLILTRREDQGICIGDTVHVRIIKIKRGAVQIGIEAPATTIILRDEIVARNAKEKENESN